MSTLLQRMARRARESPLEATPRIEPVLASSFWRGTGEDGVIEAHSEREAHARAPVPALREPHAPTAPHERTEHAELRTDDTHRAHDSETSSALDAAQEPVVVVHTTSEVQAAAQPGTPSAAHALPRHGARAKIEPLLEATPAASTGTREPSRNARRSEHTEPSRTHEQHGRETAAPVPYAPLRAESQQPRNVPEAPDPATPAITISFGRVEVRQASAPPAPPRAAFRPAVSLDAFLRRGGGNSR